MKYCLDCNKELSSNPKAVKCKVCANRGSRNPIFGKFGSENPKWTGGKYSTCRDCNKKIKKNYERCHSCAAKYFQNTKE